MAQPQDLSEHRSKLSLEKQTLLAKRVGGTNADKLNSKIPGFEIITPNPSERYQPFPMNDLQRAYMLGRSGDLALGNVTTQVYVEIENANLDLPRLNTAWQRLIERHDMLRAVMISENQQQILEQVPFYEIKTTDLRDHDDETVAAHLKSIRHSRSHQVLKADEWPLFHIEALQLNNENRERTRLLFSMDGLIADAISLFLLLNEWSLLYHNSKTSLKPLELSFRDYVLAEIDLEQSKAVRESLDYWRGRLATLPAAPDLPLAKDPADVSHPRFTRRSVRLDSQVWTKLKLNTRRAGLTPTGLLLSAYAEVLTLWSTSLRLTINVTNFNRLPLHPQVNEIVGEFRSFSLLEVNNSDASSTFQERARRIQEQLQNDMNHCLRGVKVLRELPVAQKSARKANMPVVFTSMLDLGELDQEGQTPERPGDIVYSISQAPHMWLNNQVREEDGELVIELDGVEELFGAGMLDDLFGAYSRLLRRLAEEEEAWLKSDLELLPAAHLQARQLANSTEAPVSNQLLHELFLARAAAQPEQVAIISPEARLTYAKLARQALRLAEVLRWQGARPNTLVAIVLDKGPAQVVGVLGTLMSGSAYLPLDAESPGQRLAGLLQQAQVRLVITDTEQAGRDFWPAGVALLCLDEIAAEAEIESRLAEDPGANSNGQRRKQKATTLTATAMVTGTATATDLAYVMYTSGSNGTPKGVMVTHRSIVNAIEWSNRQFEVSEADAAISVTALHHDKSVYDIFGMLCAGGRLVMPGAGEKREPRRWAELIREHEVTIWNSVPAYMQMLVAQLQAEEKRGRWGRGASLRLVLLGGDWIGVGLPEEVWEQAPRAQVVSVGGPTETTLWNIYHEVKKGVRHQVSIPYGKPIANNRYYILDELLRERPEGVAGEMYCGGVGVSAGYWEDEERSGERYFEHPVSGERLYRTGDLGRYVGEGVIEFLGRADDQVQVGEYRVEPAEVEAVLVREGGVKAAAVVAVGEERGHKQLVAYVVAADGGGGTAEEEGESRSEELQRVMKEWLPEAMVPSRYVYVSEMPLTANGKVDRRELASRLGRASGGCWQR